MLKSIAPIATAIRSSLFGFLQIAGPTAGTTRTMTVPDADFTAARTDAAQTFSGDQSFSGGNIAVSITLSNWGDTGRVELPDGRSVTAKGGTFEWGTNWYYNNGYKYASAARAANYKQENGYHKWSGTSTAGNAAGDALTLNDYMAVDPWGGFNMPGIYANTVGGTNRDVYVDNTGVVGYVSSIRASKLNILNLVDTAWLLQLNPVSFNYRKKNEDGTYSEEADGPVEYGLIAEDTEIVKAELCFYDEVNGKRQLRGVSYSKLITPMLKLIQQQQGAIEDLRTRLAALENS